MLTMVANSELHALAPDHRAVIVDMRRMSGVLFAAVLERGDSIGAFDCGDPWLAMSAIAGMSVRVAWWFRPPSPPTDEPLSSYPAEAATWLPDRDRDAEVIADAYADYALRIVGAVGADR
jgi:hypothetical protein